MNTAESKSSVVNFLASMQTDAEFKAQLERKRFLQKCKRDKFKSLYEAGLLKKPDFTNPSSSAVNRPHAKNEARKRMVADAIVRLEDGEHRKDICKDLGISVVTLYEWAKKLEIKLPSTTSIGRPIQDEFINLINVEGFTYTEALGKLSKKASQWGMRFQLKKRGLTYDKYRKKIVPCEK